MVSLLVHPSYANANTLNNADEDTREQPVEETEIEETEEVGQETNQETTEESSNSNEEASTNEADDTDTQEEEESESEIPESEVVEETMEPTYEEWLAVVENEESYLDRLTLFNESYDEWDEEETFLTDYHNTLAASLELASEKHLESDFSEALTYYEAILASKDVPEDLTEEATWKKGFAEEEQAYPIADEMYEAANAATTASAILAAFIEGYDVFPEDERFTEGVHDSAENLFNWAVSQEEKGNVETAIDRYETILGAPTLPEGLEQKIQERLEALENEASEESKTESSPEADTEPEAEVEEDSVTDANTENETEEETNVTANSVTIQQRSADVIYKEATNERTASGKLQLYTEGLNAYPNDSRFITGVESSAQTLLSWARGKHQAGDYATAIDRYETILASPGISSLTKEATTKHLARAKEKKAVPIANELWNGANKQTQASALFTHFHSALTWYPEQSRFQDGLNTSARNLLSWAKSQHEDGRFDTAKIRYQMIIDTPSVAAEIRENAKSLMADAEAGKRSADAIYKSAKEEYRASHKLALFSDGYRFYPNDTRFRDGVHQSAASLLTWAIGKHNLADYETAIDRYEAILAAPTLSSAVESETKTKLADAKQGKRPADVIYKAAQNIRTATGLFEAYQEGYAFYPNDSRFKTGLASSSQTLLDLAVRYHQQGRHSDAKSRYQVLQDTNGVPASIKELARIQQGFADRNVKIPTLEGYLKYAQEQTTASGLLTAYTDGYTLYNGDPRLEEGMIEAARNLLRWATAQHQNGRYDTALDRYNTILSLPFLNTELELETKLKKSYAEANQSFITADQLYNEAKDHYSASHQLSTYIEGYLLYPGDLRFTEGINISAQSLLDYASRKQEAGDFDTAVDRYKTIIAAPAVSGDIVKEAEEKLKYAEKGQTIPTANFLYQEAQANNTVTGKFTLFVKAYSFYPEDPRFKEGINISGLDLFRYANNQHNNKNFAGAIQRYELIISSPGVPDHLLKSAQRNLAFAKDGVVPEKEIISYTDVSSSLSQAITIQKSLNPPPQTDKYSGNAAYIHSSFISKIYDRGMSIGSTTNLRRSATLTGTIYKAVKFGTTFEILGTVNGDTTNGSNRWYKILFEGQTVYIHSSLASSARIGVLSDKANVYETTNPSSHVFSTRSKGVEVAINRNVTGNTWNNSNNWYEVKLSQWNNAKESEFISYLDPMKNDMYQHLVLSSSPGVTASQLNTILEGKGILSGKGQAFINGGLTHSVNEVYLISHALLETGHGTSALATGIEVGTNSSGNPQLVTSSNRSSLTNIKTTYNMFGIGAVDSDPDRLGAYRAYRQEWFTPEASIVGGAKFIGEDYIHNANNQNTLYKMRWNPIKPGTKQYATDMGWAVKQVVRIKSIYDQLDDPVLHFDIPKYK